MEASPIYGFITYIIATYHTINARQNFAGYMIVKITFRQLSSTLPTSIYTCTCTLAFVAKLSYWHLHEANIHMYMYERCDLQS